MECSICLNYIKENETFILECGHSYHDDCIHNCISNNIVKCPNCRTKITIVDKLKLFSNNDCNSIHFNYRQQLKNHLRRNGKILDELSNQQKDDEELVEIAYQHNPYSLQYASMRLQVKYCNKKWTNLNYVSKIIKEDREFIKKLLLKNWQVIRIVSYIYNDDEELMNIALSQSGLAIKYCSNNLLHRDLYITKALENNGFSIIYLDKIDQYNSKYRNIARYQSKIKNYYI